MPGVLSKWTAGSRSSSSPMPQEDMFRRSDKAARNPHYSNGYGSDHQSDVEDSGPSYLLEHLATFSVGPQFGVRSPKDGLRKLRQMEKSSGIWTQKMQMKLEKNLMTIIDYENGSVVDRFPTKLIVDPTACTSGDSEVYDNILIFVVKSEKNTVPHEMHIFQCSQIPAHAVVADIKAYLANGKLPSQPRRGGSRHLPPPPSQPPPEPPGSVGVSVRDQVQVFNQAASSHHPYSPRANHNRPECDDNSSLGSNCYETEVSVLNKCFDDIECFIMHLHSAVAAAKELEKKNKKSKKQDKNLVYRARPPTEKEFYEILQKFKLCFNLLAKLKNHIHDPNAAELVHFIFTPLALVVDAARESGCNPQQVSVPLLTRQAVRLLEHCCTSKETDLWHSLGHFWNVPRSEFKDIVDNYKPVFSNGYTVPPGFSDETSVLEPVPLSVPEDHYHSKAELYEERARSPADFPQPSSHHHRAMSPPDMRSNFSADSIEPDLEEQQQHWLEELLSRSAKIVQVVYHRHANNDKELTVAKNEFLEVLDDSRNWWKARNFHGQVGHVPNTIVVPYTDVDYGHSSVYGAHRGDPEILRESPKDRYSDGGSGSPSDSRRPPIPPPAPAEWVRRERQGKKGEFRYF